MLDRKLGALGALLNECAPSDAAFSGAIEETPGRSTASSWQSSFARGHRNKFPAPITASNRYIGQDEFLFLPKSFPNQLNYEAKLGAAAKTAEGNERQSASFLGRQVIRNNLNIGTCVGGVYSPLSCTFHAHITGKTSETFQDKFDKI